MLVDLLPILMGKKVHSSDSIVDVDTASAVSSSSKMNSSGRNSLPLAQNSTSFIHFWNGGSISARSRFKIFSPCRICNGIPLFSVFLPLPPHHVPSRSRHLALTPLPVWCSIPYLLQDFCWLSTTQSSGPTYQKPF